MLALLAAGRGALLLLALVLAFAHTATSSPLAPHRAASRIASSARAAAIVFPLGLRLALAKPRLYYDADAKLRAEESFLAFVELMWPVLEPGQPFSRGEVQEAIAAHLEAVTAGRLTNLLMNVPPGSTKTYLVNVFWPAWEWGPCNRPDLRYMSWSYSADLTLKANDDCRRIIKSELYQLYWGNRFALLDESDAKSFYQNDKGGWRRSSSIKGQTTGFRADRLLWDDPHNIKDADSDAELRKATRWFSRTLPTRVRNLGGGMAQVKTPFWVRRVHDPGERVVIPKDKIADLLTDREIDELTEHGFIDDFDEARFGDAGFELADAPEDKDRPVTVSATIGIMQRVHLHDISGIILKNPSLGYEVLIIEMRYRGAQHPARLSPGWKPSSIGYADWRTEHGQLADPVRFPDAEVTKLEAQLSLEGGNDAVAAQLDQWPLELGGSMFKVEWLPILPVAECPRGVDKRGWDFAGSKAKGADRTADVLVRRGIDKRFYVRDSHAFRGGPAEVDARIRLQHKHDPRDVEWSVPRDPGATGIHFVSYIGRELVPGRYLHDSPELGKVQSAKPVSSLAKGGNFIIVEHEGAEALRAEMVEFPYGEHDDLMDAISRAVALHVAHPNERGDVGGDAVTTSSALVAADDSTLSGIAV